MIEKREAYWYKGKPYATRDTVKRLMLNHMYIDWRGNPYKSPFSYRDYPEFVVEKLDEIVKLLKE